MSDKRDYAEALKKLPTKNDLEDCVWNESSDYLDSYGVDVLHALMIAKQLQDGTHVIVPVEPTKQMVSAGSDAHDDCIDEGFCSDSDGNRHDYTSISPDAPYKIYKAMIEAAQEGETK